MRASHHTRQTHASLRADSDEHASKHKNKEKKHKKVTITSLKFRLLTSAAFQGSQQDLKKFSGTRPDNWSAPQDKDKKKDAAAIAEEKRLVKEAKKFLKQRASQMLPSGSRGCHFRDAS